VCIEPDSIEQFCLSIRVIDQSHSTMWWAACIT
jgi:hypothetical protein